MAKAKRVTVRLDDELDAIINQACVDGNCDKTTVVLSAIKKGLGVTDHAAKSENGPKPISKGWVSEIRHDSGCIDRYDENGIFKMHLRPDPNSKGMYLDLKNNRWYKDRSGHWVGIVNVD